MILVQNHQLTPCRAELLAHATYIMALRTPLGNQVTKRHGLSKASVCYRAK